MWALDGRNGWEFDGFGQRAAPNFDAFDSARTKGAQPKHGQNFDAFDGARTDYGGPSMAKNLTGTLPENLTI